MKLALQDKLLQKPTYEETFKAARELGFHGVELTLFGAPLDEKKVEEIQKASDRSNIPVSALCGGYRGWIGDFEKNQRLLAVEDIKTSLKYVKELGGEGLIAPAAFGMYSDRLPSSGKPRSEKEDEEALVDSLARIAETAEEQSVPLLLEPLNRYEDHMINRVEQAVTLIEKVGSSSIKVLGDFFHMNIEEADIHHTIQQYASYLEYFHLADNNRLQPGKGHIDFSSYLRKLEDQQYQGYLSLECGVSGDPNSSLSETLHSLQQQLKTKEVE